MLPGPGSAAGSRRSHIRPVGPGAGRGPSLSRAVRVAGGLSRGRAVRVDPVADVLAGAGLLLSLSLEPVPDVLGWLSASSCAREFARSRARACRRFVSGGFEVASESDGWAAGTSQAPRACGRASVQTHARTPRPRVGFRRSAPQSRLRGAPGAASLFA